MARQNPLSTLVDTPSYAAGSKGHPLRVVGGNPDIPPKGPGAAARAWVHDQAGLTRGERAVLLAWAWYCNGDWLTWPSRASVGQRSGYGLRQVQKNTERLVAIGYLVDQGMKTTRGRDAQPIKRTRLYRLAVGLALVPVMPATVRRRLARLQAVASDGGGKMDKDEYRVAHQKT